MKNKLIQLLLGNLLVLAVIASSCTNKRDDSRLLSDCNVINAKFSNSVLPIIQRSCSINAGCHGENSTNGPGVLSNYTQIHNAAASIKTAVMTKRMPIGSSLAESDIKTISCWIDGGAQNN